MRPEDEVQPDLNPRVLNPRVTSALQALCDADRGVEAPPQVEATLRAAFRSRAQSNRARTGRMRMWRWVPAVAAAAILLIAAAYYRSSRAEPIRVASGVAHREAATPGIQPQITLTQPGIIRAPAAQTTRPRARRGPYSQPQEIATDFFPLVEFAPPVDNVDGGELVRVSLPASAMRDVGLPVREDRLEDRVQADVLVSNGMATAIRFVKNMQ